MGRRRWSWPGSSAGGWNINTAINIKQMRSNLNEMSFNNSRLCLDSVIALRQMFDVGGVRGAAI